MGQLSSCGENYELCCSVVICCAFNMELSSDEKCAFERDSVVKIVKEAGETLSFRDVIQIYVEKYKRDLKQWKEEFTNFGAFLKYGAGSDVVDVGESVSLCFSVVSKSGEFITCSAFVKPQFSPFFGFFEGEQRHNGVDYPIWRYEVESAVSLKWAVAEKFWDYLYGSRFHVITDSNHLTYLLTSAKLSPSDHRWLSSLAIFDFEIYRCGKANGDANGLSRIPVNGGEGNRQVLSDEQCQTLLEPLETTSGGWLCLLTRVLPGHLPGLFSR